MVGAKESWVWANSVATRREEKRRERERDREREREKEKENKQHQPIEATVLSLFLYFLSLSSAFSGVLIREEFWYPGDVKRWRQLLQR